MGELPRERLGVLDGAVGDAREGGQMIRIVVTLASLRVCEGLHRGAHFITYRLHFTNHASISRSAGHRCPSS